VEINTAMRWRGSGLIARARNLPISGIIQEHAKEVPKKPGKSEFWASNRRL
jgi:hypothetical protein